MRKYMRSILLKTDICSSHICPINKLYYNAKLFAGICASGYRKNDILKFDRVIFYKQVSDPRKYAPPIVVAYWPCIKLQIKCLGCYRPTY